MLPTPVDRRSAKLLPGRIRRARYPGVRRVADVPRGIAIDPELPPVLASASAPSRATLLREAPFHPLYPRQSPRTYSFNGQARHFSGRRIHEPLADHYIKVNGRWTYLYRAVDKQGRTVDFRLSERRDVAAAKAFFRKALTHNGTPRVITRSGSLAYDSVRRLWI